jgi:hypothetical protein
MPTAIAIPARKRLAWHAWLDMPVGLEPPRTADAEPAGHILLGETSLRNDGPYGPDAQRGWLVMLALTNTGWSPVRGSDFVVPLTFTFPGRQILSAQISPDPADQAATRPARPPSLCLSTGSSRLLSPGYRSQACIQVTGDFLLRPRRSCTIAVILSGTPAPDSPRVQQEGSLAGGKIVIGSDDSGAHPSLA